MSAPLELVLEESLTPAAQHDVKAIGQTLQGDSHIEVQLRDQLFRGGFVRDSGDDGIVRNERVPFKIHLGDQALRETGTEDREMDVSGAPAVDEVSKRVRAWLDCSEKIMTVIVSDHSSAAAEIRIDRRFESIVPVAIATAGVGLPNLDESSRNRTSVFIQHEAVNDNALPNRVAVFRVVKNQVVIERP